MAQGSDSLIGEQPMASIIIVNTVICSVCILVNIPSCLLVLFGKICPRNVKCMQVVSISFSDLLTGVAGIMITSDYSTYGNLSTYSMCTFRYLLFVTAYFNNGSQLFILIFSRIYMMQKSRPIFQIKRSLFRVLLINFLITTLLTTGVCIVGILQVKPNDQPEKQRCIIENTFMNNSKLLAYVCFCSWLLEIMIVCGQLVMLVMLLKWRQKKKVAWQRVNTLTMMGSKMKMSKEEKTILSLFLISIMYVLCTTPLNLVLLLKNVLSDPIPRKFRVIASGIHVLNNILNPCVYFFVLPEIKSDIKRLCLKTNILCNEDT